MTDQHYFETVMRRTDHPGRARALLAKRRLQAEDRKQMKINTHRRETMQIRTMIERLDRAVSSLESNIGAELARARVRDPSHFAYPIPARAMAARRDNLNATIAMLSGRLAKIDALLTDTVADGMIPTKDGVAMPEKLPSETATNALPP
jgi:hypothetical protein